MKATQYNKFNRKFNVTLDGMEFVKLETLYKNQPDEVYKVTGLFINRKSKFGDRPYISTPDFLADLPKFMLEDVGDMINDPEVVEEINRGEVGFKVHAYNSKTYNKECYSIIFVEYRDQMGIDETLPEKF